MYPLATGPIMYSSTRVVIIIIVTDQIVIPLIMTLVVTGEWNIELNNSLIITLDEVLMC